MEMYKTDVKCSGCHKDLPREHYDVKKRRATWFGIYTCDKLKDWVCVECWDKGARYDGYVNRMSR